MTSPRPAIEYKRRAEAIKSYAKSHGLQPVVREANGGPVRFMITGEEKYVRRTIVEYRALSLSRKEIPVYDHRNFTRSVVLDKPRANVVMGVAMYQRLRSEDLANSDPITNSDGSSPPTYSIGKLDEAASDYMSSTVAGYNERVLAADGPTTRYIMLLSLRQWEQACLKSLGEMEASLSVAKSAARAPPAPAESPDLLIGLCGRTIGRWSVRVRFVRPGLIAGRTDQTACLPLGR